MKYETTELKKLKVNERFRFQEEHEIMERTELFKTRKIGVKKATGEIKYLQADTLIFKFIEL